MPAQQALFITVLWLPMAVVGFVPVVFACIALETGPPGFFQWMVALSLQCFPLACVGCAGTPWVYLAVDRVLTVELEAMARNWLTRLVLPAAPLLHGGGGWLGRRLLG